MHDLSEEYWNNRYINEDFVWDTGGVSLPLKSYIEQLTNKELRILIPGAGNAHEALFLAENGFKQVYVLDFAEKPLSDFKKQNPSFPAGQLIQQNFFEHTGQYDLIIEQTFFCAIDPLLRTEYVMHMKRLLKQGGKLVGVLFNDALNTDKPPFGGNKEQYEGLFKEDFNIKKMELCYNSIKPRQDRELFIIMQKD
jgi:SAM-dependent methyltransferase